MSTKVLPKESLAKALSTTAGLKETEILIEQKLSSEAKLLTEIPSYLFNLGGKRIRPLICLLVAKMFGLSKATAALVEVAAAIELIHSATLLHDDIIDKSTKRRNEASPYVKFGLAGTLLSGDFLLVRAFGLCARLDRYIINITEDACIRLTEGEILETPLFLERHSLDSSLTIARKKTASLFSLASESSAFLAGLRDKNLATMRKFGEELGIAFQIMDDVLDVDADEALSGKQVGVDIRERKPSIVNILWLNNGSALAQKLLTEPGSEEDSFVRDAINEIRSLRILEKAKTLAKQHAANAIQALSDAVRDFDGNVEEESFEQLNAIQDYVLERLR